MSEIFKNRPVEDKHKRGKRSLSKTRVDFKCRLPYRKQDVGWKDHSHIKTILGGIPECWQLSYPIVSVIKVSKE